MSGRTFAQINNGLLKSQKMRSLGHAEKWVYLCAHLTTFATFSGVFHYPSVMWAHDACLSTADFEMARAKLIEVGLIEYDPAEEMVRVIGAHRQRPPENASRTIALVGDFQSALASGGCEVGILWRGIAELVVAALTRAQAWKPDSPDMSKLREVLKPFLAATFQDGGNGFLAALNAEMGAATKAVRSELWALLPPLMTFAEDRVTAPCLDRGDTRDLDETRPRRDKDEYKDSDDAPFRETETAFRLEASELLRKGASGQAAPMPRPHSKTLTSRIAIEARESNRLTRLSPPENQR